MDHFCRTHWFYLHVPCDWWLTGRAKDETLYSWSVAEFALRWFRCAQVLGKLQQWKSRLMSRSFTSDFKLACSCYSHSGGCVLLHTLQVCPVAVSRSCFLTHLMLAKVTPCCCIGDARSDEGSIWDAGQATTMALWCTLYIAAVGTGSQHLHLPRTGITPPQKGFSHLGTTTDLAEDIFILINGFISVLSCSPEWWVQDCVC